MYDLFVLTFNEKKCSRLQSNSICVKALNKNGHAKQKYYHQIWPFINNCYGILYKLFTKERLGEFECCDEMFEFNAANNSECSLYKFAPNITDECIEDWVSIKLNEDYKAGFIALFDLLLSCSPTSTIAFLCRGQSIDKEVVLGSLSRNDFLQMLCLGGIKTNICYLIEG
jgi:hypothetical protein